MSMLSTVDMVVQRRDGVAGYATMMTMMMMMMMMMMMICVYRTDERRCTMQRRTLKKTWSNYCSVERPTQPYKAG